MEVVNRRILIVDDNKDIHEDFRKILGGKKSTAHSRVEEMELQIFSDDSDEDDDFEITKTNPSLNYEISSAYQGTEAIRMVDKAYEEERPYAMIFMDVRMPPGIDGIEAISRIWRKHPDVEVIICTAYSDYSFEAILKKLGSTDRLLFLNKPFDSIAVKQMALSLTRKWTLYQSAKKHVARLKEEITQRRTSEQRLQYLVHHDSLTGLGNRNLLQIALGNAIEEARDSGTRFALLFIDLDRFKDINDTLGYQNGDKLIKTIGSRLEKEFHDEAKIYRHGGDEFALLLPKIISIDHVAKIANRIHTTFEDTFELDDISIGVQASIGIVIYPDHGSNIDMLMRYADMTLVNAKKTDLGYGFYASHLNLYSPQRLTLLSDLRNAVTNNELVLYYHPKVRYSDSAIVGVEALIRWAHADHGFIPPNEFIPLAVSCGIIRDLTKWVLQRVSQQWARWNQHGFDFAVSINISSQDLLDANLFNFLAELFENNPMPTSRLSLEISEVGVMEDPRQAVNILKKIHAMGIGLTIDNFGTGYASLAYLKTLPVSEIKIDGSFITELGKNMNDVAIVQSMIDLGHNLGLSVAADGVATPQVFHLLEEFGCDLAQGEVINQPVPPGELMLWADYCPWEISRDDDEKSPFLEDRAKCS